MRLASFSADGVRKFGIVVDDGLIDLNKALNHRYHDLKHFLTEGSMDELQPFLDRQADYSLTDVKFLPVIDNPEKIICIGVNYDEHRLETNRERSKYPIVFFRVPSSQIGHGEPMILPKESEKLDYEGEIAVVIGKPARRVAPEEAYDYIAGYSCYNDGTIRDWQLHTQQWGPGKNFDGTGAFGPWLVTRDEIRDGEVLNIQTRLNGQVMQKATTDMMLFPIPELIAYTSKFTTLKPGDVIVTGTPGGVGAKRNPPVFMKKGDVIEVEVSKIGVLKNRIY